MFETFFSAFTQDHSLLPLAVLVIGGAMFIGGMVLMFSGRSFKTGRLPYHVKPYLFTKAEWHFHRALAAGLSKDFLVFSYVRMADVMRVKGISRKDRTWMEHFSKISSKHLDFIVCGQGQGEILCALELDDSSHTRKDRLKRDAFVDKACASAGLPLIRIKAQPSYNPDSLRDKVTRAIDAEKARRP